MKNPTFLGRAQILVEVGECKNGSPNNATYMPGGFSKLFARGLQFAVPGLKHQYGAVAKPGSLNL